MIYEEIFGYEDVSVVSAKPVPDLPWEWDAFRQQLTPENSGGGVAFSKIESYALAEEILGPTPESASGDSPVLEQFRKIVPLPVLTFTAPVATANLLKLATRVQEVQKRAPERQRTIAGILSDIRQKLGGPTNQEAWNRLQQSCEKFVASALIA